MNTQGQVTEETRALAANDIHVLVGQLNEAIKRGAESGLRVDLDCAGIIDVRGTATHYPVVTVKILAEFR